MTKHELLDAIAKRAGLSRREAEAAYDALLGEITDEMQRGNEVTLTGFGTFLPKHRAARVGVDPRDPSKRIQMPAVTVPKFKAGSALKDALKKKADTAE